MLLVSSPNRFPVGGMSRHRFFQISLNKSEIFVGEIGSIFVISHEVISDFDIRVPLFLLYSSVQTIKVSARTESTSIATVLVGPMPDMIDRELLVRIIIYAL